MYNFIIVHNKTIYFTTSIFYANAKPHIGAATEMIIADFFNRSYKMFGYQTFLLTGTDEHGDKIAKTATKNNLTNMEFLNKNVLFFKELAVQLNISYDKFIRTTDKSHVQTVQKFWLSLENKGLIYKGQYSGFYSQRDETFFQDKDLINGKAPTGADVQFITYECYFLKTSIFRDKLLELYNQNSITVPINRINELKSFISKEYKDLCISRPSGSWGIGVPNKTDVIYVWFDALINYLTACNYPNIDQKWNNTIHIIGKDILTFHGVHWPAILMANEISLFQKILVHNWWLMPEGKMSKSLGNVICPMELINKYGINAMRFFLLKDNLMTNDQIFNEKIICNYYNEFLVNKFSNLVYRTQSIVLKNQLKYKEINYQSNSIYVKQLEKSILDFNINIYINTCFRWCDELNSKVESEKIWANTNKAPLIFNEVLELIKYFTPILPSLIKFNPDNLQILFKRMKTIFYD